MDGETLKHLLDTVKSDGESANFYEFEPGKFCVCLRWGISTIFLTSAYDYAEFCKARTILNWLKLPPVTTHGESRDVERTK